MTDRRDLESGLERVGEILASRGEVFAIVIVGGTALNLLGIVDRRTTDVDIIAFANVAPGQESHLLPAPLELPKALADAAARVADDLGLARDWLNTGPALQWQTGLPPDMATRIEWRSYGALRVGIAGRRDLVFLKLFAASDSPGADSVHFQDLLALGPTAEELAAAASWVLTQDVSEPFPESLEAVMKHARHQLGLD